MTSALSAFMRTVFAGPKFYRLGLCPTPALHTTQLVLMTAFLFREITCLHRQCRAIYTGAIPAKKHLDKAKLGSAFPPLSRSPTLHGIHYHAAFAAHRFPALALASAPSSRLPLAFCPSLTSPSSWRVSLSTVLSTDGWCRIFAVMWVLMLMH